MYHILIAEDERIERTVLAGTLSRHLGEGYHIHQAANGRQAVELFREHPIRTAILDIEMPVMSGIETAQIIFGEDPTCAIIFLTAFDRFDYAHKAISVRAVDYLLKPYEDKELLAVVETAVHRGSKVVTASGGAKEPGGGKGDRIGAVAVKMKEYIHDHYWQDISMQDAACVFNYSEPYFCKIFKQQYGQSFTAYLTEYRIGRAKELLGRPAVNIKDVGVKVGYADPNYFAKVFRRMTGQSPSEYRLAHLT